MPDTSVGLIVVMDVPTIGLVVVLRERGFFNPEKMKPESWPGACQVTAHGRLEEGEDFKTALLRETEEELGKSFAFNILCLIDKDPAALAEVTRLNKSDKVAVTFTIKVDCLLLKKIRLAPESGAIRLISLAETAEIVDVRSFDKATGVQDSRVIAMFPDEREAVINALKHFSPQRAP